MTDLEHLRDIIDPRQVNPVWPSRSPHLPDLKAWREYRREWRWMYAILLLALVVVLLSVASAFAQKPTAWVILEFVLPDGTPAQMAFSNPRVPDMTLAECKGSLPRNQAALVRAAMEQEPKLANAKFKSAECIWSAVDPIKPK